MPLSWIARGAASAERGRRLIALRGVTPNGHPVWEGWEVRPVVERSDYRSIFPLLDRRTHPAVYKKASRLGVTKQRTTFSDAEILRLGLYRTASKAEVMAALPGHTWEAIGCAARKRGHRRPKPLIAVSGIRIVDQIHQRARALGFTLRDLDEAARRKGFFSRKHWRGKLDHSAIRRTVEALGGQIRASFPRSGEAP